MKLAADDRRILLRFIDKVDRLSNSRFLSYMRSGGQASVSIRWSTLRGTEVTLAAPDDESVDAFLLTLRMFLQNNDDLSIRNVADLLDRIEVDPLLRDQFHTYRDTLNRWLASPLAKETNGERPTFGEILNVVLYGDRGHSTDKQVKRLERLRGAPLAYTDIDITFVAVLMQVWSCLSLMRQLIARMVSDPKQLPPADDMDPYDQSEAVPAHDAAKR